MCILFGKLIYSWLTMDFLHLRYTLFRIWSSELCVDGFFFFRQLNSIQIVRDLVQDVIMFIN